VPHTPNWGVPASAAYLLKLLSASSSSARPSFNAWQNLRNATTLPSSAVNREGAPTAKFYDSTAYCRDIIYIPIVYAITIARNWLVDVPPTAIQSAMLVKSRIIAPNNRDQLGPKPSPATCAGLP
jgi:hypothetical protein